MVIQRTSEKERENQNMLNFIETTADYLHILMQTTYNGKLCMSLEFRSFPLVIRKTSM